MLVNEFILDVTGQDELVIYLILVGGRITRPSQEEITF
jgi:hypothetical protein